jgi:hypothetical protein
MKKIISAIALLCCGIIAANEKLDIVKEGKSNYQIIVSPKAFPITQRAAEDLQTYIKKSTGAELPIVKSEKPGEKPAIIVGVNKTVKEVGINLEQIKPEGFVIKTIGRNIYIVGKDTKGSANSDHWRDAPQSGTWYGVAEFLESQLGVRWFFPGEKGEYVPKHKNLSIGKIDFSDAPKMIHRRLNYQWWKGMSPDKIKEVKEWKRRNRAGRSLVWCAWHTWTVNFKGETYFKEHPEWFAQVNGRRLGYAPHGLQMCTTNKEALDEFAKVIIEKRKNNPQVMFSLSPNDGGNHCECEKCRALDVETAPDGTPVMTDRYMTYCNEIAQRVCKTLPDQKFGMYAYSFYRNPPQKTKLNPNVFICDVMNGVALQYQSEEIVRDHLKKRLLPWKKMVDNLLFYTFPSGMGSQDLPGEFPNGIGRLFDNLSKAEVKGIQMNLPSSTGSTGLNKYLFMKMAWNPSRNIEKVYDDALKKCYGEKAAPYILDYFDEVESRLKRFAQKGIKMNLAMGSVRSMPQIIDFSYSGLCEKGMPLLQKAIASTDDENQKARIKILMDNLELTKMTVDLYALSKKIIGNQNPSPELILQARDIAKKRRETFAKLNQSLLYGLNEKSIMEQEKIFNLPFDPKVYDFMLLAAKGGKKKATAKPVKQAPVIDGKLDDEAWKGLEELNVNLNKDNASPSKLKTVAKIARDKDFLYISVYSEEPNAKKIVDSVKKHDGEVWKENEIELFFDSNNDQKSYYQFCINTLGTVMDKRKTANGKSDKLWDSKAKTATSKGDDYWTMEIAIPLESLSDKIRPGDIWGFNICRVRTVDYPREYTCWSPTFGLFGKPKRFGKLILR